MHSLEVLRIAASPTPKPPSDNPLLEVVGIFSEAPHENNLK